MKGLRGSDKVGARSVEPGRLGASSDAPKVGPAAERLLRGRTHCGVRLDGEHGCARVEE
jgi:hypothetical protein